VLRRDLAQQAHELVDATIGAGVGGRADDHRHAEPAGFDQHHLQVVALPRFEADMLIGAERPRTHVAGAGIGDDVVGPQRATMQEAGLLQRGEGQVAGRTKDRLDCHHVLRC
jgi:hypothetical protein